MEEYNPKWDYVKGLEKCAVDALSRLEITPKFSDIRRTHIWKNMLLQLFFCKSVRSAEICLKNKNWKTTDAEAMFWNTPRNPPQDSEKNTREKH